MVGHWTKDLSDVGLNPVGCWVLFDSSLCAWTSCWFFGTGLKHLLIVRRTLAYKWPNAVPYNFPILLGCYGVYAVGMELDKWVVTFINRVTNIVVKYFYHVSPFDDLAFDKCRSTNVHLTNCHSKFSPSKSILSEFLLGWALTSLEFGFGCIISKEERGFPSLSLSLSCFVYLSRSLSFVHFYLEAI